MSRRVKRREPRAHWLLLLLGMTALFVALCLNGFVEGIVGGSGRAGAVASGGRAPLDVPTEVTGGGPVVRLDGEVPQTRRMPARTIALTFDDGPDPVWTPRVLDLLRQHGAQATFFVVGAEVNKHPELVRRMLAEGHEVGSHTFTHADLASAPDWRRDLEMTLTRNAIAGATGRQVTLFRPPYSSVSSGVTAEDYVAMREVARTGHVAVLADLDTNDWRRPSPSGAGGRCATRRSARRGSPTRSRSSSPSRWAWRCCDWSSS